MTRPWLAVFKSRRMAVLFLFGFSSGLPLYLTGQLLQAWLSQAEVPLSAIASFQAVGLAYTIKFAWAPLMDRYALPFLGRRRGWILTTQIGLAVAIVGMGLLDPTKQPGALAVFAVAVAVLSASQDIVLDAYNADLLTPEQRAAGAAIYVIGYRVAMLVTGTAALFLADYIPWSIIYAVIGGLVLACAAATFAAEEPAAPARPVTTLAAAIYRPFVELFKSLGARTALAVLVFVAIYKFGDSFAQALLIAFLKRGLGFEFREIAAFNKIGGFAGMFVGGFVAGSLVARFGMRKMLFAFGILQACTNLLYAWLALAGPSYPLFAVSVFFDNLTGAMGTAAFVAFLMSVCTPGVSATQFALLTSLSSVGQRVFGPFADDIVVRIDPHGVGHVAHASATFDTVIRPQLEHALAAPSIDWQHVADVVRWGSHLRYLLNPIGADAVVRYQWSTFFVVTALMAIPGILLVFAVTRDRNLPAAPRSVT